MSLLPKIALCIVGISASIISLFSFNCPSGDGGGIIDIDITTPPPASNKPKAPVLIPVSARYYEISQEIVLSFTANLGNVSVTVLNVTTGESVNDVVDTSDGIVSCPISGTAGEYLLLVIPFGSQISYIGEFAIN